MQSFSLFPPVLENQLEAVKWVANPTFSYSNSVIIKFELSKYAVWDEIKHVQIAIRDKATNNIAVNNEISPDQQVIYIQKNCNQLNEHDIVGYDAETNICTIVLPFICFKGGNLIPNTTYNIQIRFGADNLWCNQTGEPPYQHSGINPSNVNGYAWHLFAGWRAQQVSQGNFGEWSNTTSLFCYSSVNYSLSCSMDNYIPHFVFRYNPGDNDDNLEQVAINYSYANMYGNVVKNLIFNSRTIQDKSTENYKTGYIVEFDLPIAPVVPIKVVAEGYTSKNIRLATARNVIPGPVGWNNWETNPTYSTDYNIHFVNNTSSLSPEEQEDGILSFYFDSGNPTFDSNITTSGYYSIYRINLYSLDVVALVEDKPWAANSRYFFKDFSVEMGEEYNYVVVLKNSTKNKFQFLTPLSETWGYDSPGYGRLMRMDAIFLTTSKHQLRLIGNVKLSAFKRNTSDQFQTTIGSRYPFYSRNAETNYRTFNFEGLVTILLDPTSTFFYNDLENGLRWNESGLERTITINNENNSENLTIDTDSRLIILNKDLYVDNQISLSRTRIDGATKLKALDSIDPEDIKGPTSIYDNYLHRNIARIDDPYSDQLIYTERKFREFVMSWLSDGKPKLFRSETEGNMIVILTGINFTPYEASGRRVYQVSAAATEIAEYNLENLVKYNILPIDIKTQILGLPVNLQVGDKIKAEDYQSLVRLYPDIFEGCFYDLVGDGLEYTFETTDQDKILEINNILSKISTFNYVPGQEDFNIDNYLCCSKDVDFGNLEDGSMIATTYLEDYLLNSSSDVKMTIINHGWPFAFAESETWQEDPMDIKINCQNAQFEYNKVLRDFFNYTSSEEYLAIVQQPILENVSSDTSTAIMNNLRLRSVLESYGDNVSLFELRKYYNESEGALKSAIKEFIDLIISYDPAYTTFLNEENGLLTLAKQGIETAYLHSSAFSETSFVTTNEYNVGTLLTYKNAIIPISQLKVGSKISLKSNSRKMVLTNAIASSDTQIWYRDLNVGKDYEITLSDYTYFQNNNITRILCRVTQPGHIWSATEFPTVYLLNPESLLPWEEWLTLVEVASDWRLRGWAEAIILNGSTEKDYFETAYGQNHTFPARQVLIEVIDIYKNYNQVTLIPINIGQIFKPLSGSIGQEVEQNG